MKNYKVKENYGDTHGKIIGDFIGISATKYDTVVFFVNSNGVIQQDLADAIILIEEK